MINDARKILNGPFIIKYRGLFAILYDIGHIGKSPFSLFLLKTELMEIYSEVFKYGISVCLDFNREKNAYIKFTKGPWTHTHLEKKDDDDCMNGVKMARERSVTMGKIIS